MRGILFRGKTVDTNEWMEGSLVRALGYLVEDEKFFIIPEDALYYNHGEFDIVKEVSRETIGQYTGLTDKNGTKIFEGDILRVVGCYFDVIYRNGGFVWRDMRLNKFVNYANSDSNIEQFSFVEVIDNIHDNLKLLKGGKE